MPGYKRKRTSTAARRRTRRKYARVPRRMSRLSNNVHHFKRTCELAPAIVANSVAAVFGSIQFTLGMLPNVSEFTALYDQYRINKIKVVLVPALTGLDGNPQSTSYYMPNFHSILDYDDSNAPTALSQLMEHPNYRRTRGQRDHKRYFTPAVAAEIYQSGVSTSYSQKFKQWLDLASTSVPHYGLKYCVDVGNPAGGTQWAWRQYVTFYFSCKGVR